MKQFLKEFFTAYYDPLNDKIINAKKGSLVYYHEEGHKKSCKSGRMGLLQLWSYIFIFFVLCFLVTETFFLARIFLLISISFIMYEEVTAWIYAFNKIL